MARQLIQHLLPQTSCLARIEKEPEPLFATHRHRHTCMDSILEWSPHSSRSNCSNSKMAIKEDKIPNIQPPYKLDKKLPNSLTIYPRPPKGPSIHQPTNFFSFHHWPTHNTTCTDLIPNWPHITLLKQEAEEQKITEASMTHLLAGKIAATATATADCRGIGDYRVTLQEQERSKESPPTPNSPNFCHYVTAPLSANWLKRRKEEGSRKKTLLPLPPSLSFLFFLSVVYLYLSWLPLLCQQQPAATAPLLLSLSLSLVIALCGGGFTHAHKNHPPHDVKM